MTHGSVVPRGVFVSKLPEDYYEQAMRDIVAAAEQVRGRGVRGYFIGELPEDRYERHLREIDAAAEQLRNVMNFVGGQNPAPMQEE